MENLTIYIAIYLTGYVLGYLAMKKAIKNKSTKWTKGDRALSLSASLFSWIAFTSGLAAIFVQYILSQDFNEDAKW